jgi:hypothetical protein
MTLRRTVALLTTAGIAALAMTGATAAGASSTSPGIEHWTVESTNPVSAIATLIARGPLTIGGTINLQTGHVQLPGGTLTLSHQQAWGTQGENPRTCLATLTSAGTYRVADGTGRYSHISGHGTYKLTAYAIVRKINGHCATKVIPYAQTELLTADGPLTG